MSSFEFVFTLLVILLGLALAEVLGGAARVIKRRPRIAIGWATGLLAAWACEEIVLFWRVVWRARGSIDDSPATLFAGFAITALYYFAGALVFPDELKGRTSLDDYFLQDKAKVIGSLLGAYALAQLLRPAAMGWASWSFMGWIDWAVLVLLFAAGIAALLTRRLGVATALLAFLVLLDLSDPIEWLIWPH